MVCFKAGLKMAALILACLFFCGLVAEKLSAQTLASITGTVTDTSGGVIADAKVTVTNDSTGVAKVVTTTSAGSYTVTDLLPGTYTVKVENAGFQASIHSGVGVETAHAATVDASLTTGSVTETVTVQENQITLNTTQPDLNTTIENKVVQELPDQVSGGRGRQIDAFIFLAPGVTGDTFSHRINGGTDFQNEVVFNGVAMAQSETQGYQTIWNPPFELVNEFNVLRSSFSAQYGLAQGVITYHTASGGNAFHGDGFEIIRNDFFDAKGAYNTTVPVDKENNYGFSIGGPVILPHLYNGKNRTFFHISAEWYRENLTDTTAFSLATAAEKTGDFSGLVDSSGKQVPVFNPAGSGCGANGNTPGTPFRGNVIPRACFSPLSASLLQYLPDPSRPGFVNNATDLSGVLPQRQNPWGFSIDHSITDKQSIHWAEWRNKQTRFGDNTGTHLPFSSPLADKTYYPNLGTVFIANYAYAISPHLVMTAGASWLGELNFQLPQRDQATPAFSAAPGAPIIPSIRFEGNLKPSDFGSANTNAVNRKLGVVFDNNYLLIKGRQTWNLGFEYRRTYQDDNECQNCAGNFYFSNNTTADPNNLSSTGNSFASYLLGLVDHANRIGSIEQRLRNRAYSFYFQDDIKWTSKLTFNLGIRWDIMQPFTAIGNNIVYFDSTIPNPAADGRLGAATKFGTCTGCAGIDRADISYKHFSPRGGFSYQMGDKTVFNGGFSMNFLDGGAYEYGTSKVAVNYGNLLLGSYTRASTGTATPAFGLWDVNQAPGPAQTPFSPTLGVATSINAFNPKTDGLAPYDLVWNIGMQRELPSNMFLTLNYTGNRGNRLPAQLNPINQIDTKYLALGSLLGQSITSPAAIAAGIKSPYSGFVSQFGSSATVLQALRPYPQYSSIFDNFDNSGSSFYNALQVEVDKHYSDGLSFLVSYNLSRLMSNTNSGFTSFVSTSLDKNNQKQEWSIDNNDSTHAIKIAATYELPFGKGRPYMNRGGITNVILGGWQLSPILTYATGLPLQITVPGNPLGNGTSNRPNVVNGTTQQFSYSNVYSGKPVLNAAAFSDPGLWVIGNEQRYLGSIRGPFRFNENIAAAKYFPIGEHVKIKLEVEFFNALNRVIFGTPETGLLNSNFGQVTNSQDNKPRQGQGHFEIRF